MSMSFSLRCRSFRTILCKYSLLKNHKLFISTRGMVTVLGIETSCDDTGCAVVNSNKSVLGESLISQNKIHLRYGGVIPTIARELHQDNIHTAVSEALTKSKLTLKDIDVIAVTTKPGLISSLKVGVKYANFLAKKHQKPLIPIHHMEAHALTARICHDISFPYLVLLISGGHCLLGLVRSVHDFILFGKTLDNAPGEALDKAARRMKLRNVPEYAQISGGKAIELAARKATDDKMFQFTTPLLRSRDCNFSFSGLKESLFRKLFRKEQEHEIQGGTLIPEINNLCAAYQLAITEHIIHRLERAIMYCDKNNYLPPGKRNLVVSGGVASNNFIFNSLKQFGTTVNFSVYRPPPNLCTDNGVMIAWNGVERLQAKCDNSVSQIKEKDVDPVATFGENHIDQVSKANIPTRFTKLKMYGI